jgi:hypothetical protein
MERQHPFAPRCRDTWPLAMCEHAQFKQQHEMREHFILSALSASRISNIWCTIQNESVARTKNGNPGRSVSLCCLKHVLFVRGEDGAQGARLWAEMKFRTDEIEHLQPPTQYSSPPLQTRAGPAQTSELPLHSKLGPCRTVSACICARMTSSSPFVTIRTGAFSVPSGFRYTMVTFEFAGTTN